MRPPIPLIGLKGNDKILRRFEGKIGSRDGGSRDDCWLWVGGHGRNLDGSHRAQFRIGTSRYASRAAYALYIGDVHAGELVLHSCDNGMCVNPKHLRIGTHKDNTKDMIDRRRHGCWPEGVERKRGYKRPFMNRVCKLTDGMVRAIRQDRRTGWRDMEILAWEFGVSREHVLAIKQRRRKAHVSDEGPVAVGVPRSCGAPVTPVDADGR